MESETWTQIRERVAGLRTVVVSNRKDHRLQSIVEKHLGLSVKWVVSSPRKLDAIATSIAQGNYGLVIALTGWLRHKAESKLLPAARRGDAIYIRGYKGRPTALRLALARDLGIA